MAKKKYDEASVLRSLGKRVVVDYGNKTITYNNTTGLIGNKSLGKLDFLEHYCGWHIMPTSKLAVVVSNGSDKPSKRRKKNPEEAPVNTKKTKKMK